MVSMSVVQTSLAPVDELLQGRDHDLLMTVLLPQPSRHLELGLSHIIHSFTCAPMQTLRGVPALYCRTQYGENGSGKVGHADTGTIRILMEQGLSRM